MNNPKINSHHLVPPYTKMDFVEHGSFDETKSVMRA